MDKINQFRSDAWLLWGLTGNLPGSLSFNNNQLSYRAHGFGTLGQRQLEKLEQLAQKPGLADKLNNAQTAPVFNVPIKDVSIKFPWYYFSGGLKVRLQEASFRFSFARPNDPSRLGAGPGIGEARRIGKTWRSIIDRQFEK